MEGNCIISNKLSNMESNSNKKPRWGSSLSLRTSKFIEQAKSIHNNKYDYSKVVYHNTKSKVCIICPEHGEFWQTPCHHLENHGCPYCYNEKRHHQKKTLDKEKFIQRANKIHNNKYDYSKVEYINYHTKVCIICPEHGEFWQTPANHIFGSGKGCPKCNLHCWDTESFISFAKKIHHNEYDYSKVNYVDSKTKVCIICPRHGKFWQTPNNHLNGQGCPKCNKSKMEIDIENILIKNNITYTKEKTFNWLKYNNYMFLDFYLPEYNIAIECQGEQHFRSIEYYGGDQDFEERITRDKLKYDLCKENGIRVLYYTDVKLQEYPYEVIMDIDELIKRIKSY